MEMPPSGSRELQMKGLLWQGSPKNQSLTSNSCPAHQPTDHNPARQCQSHEKLSVPNLTLPRPLLYSSPGRLETETESSKGRGGKDSRSPPPSAPTQEGLNLRNKKILFQAWRVSYFMSWAFWIKITFGNLKIFIQWLGGQIKVLYDYTPWALFFRPVNYTFFSSHLAICIQRFTWVLRNFIRGGKKTYKHTGNQTYTAMFSRLGWVTVKLQKG